MEIIVQKEDLLLNYLYNHLAMPKKRIKQFLVHGCIYMNHQSITKYDYKVKPGMKIFIDTKQNKKEYPFQILFEDEAMIVVDKPSGLLSIATEKEKENTLYHMVREYLREKEKNAKIFIVHRLDKDTSGIVVFAKNEKLKQDLQDHWKEYASLREYVAVVHGILKEKEKKVIQYLKEGKTGLVYPCQKREGKEAITFYQVIKENKDYSMLRIEIETGRKNQIRVALHTMNHPIVGDKKYGLKKDRQKRLYLHANRLRLYCPHIKKEILFETKVPIEFKKMIK